MIRRTKKIAGAILAAIFTLAVFSSCDKAATPPAAVPLSATPSFASFQDIPGATAEETAAIEALRQRYSHFVYGAVDTTEAFPVYPKQDNKIGGYSALLCGWLTDLFDIQFVPTLYEDDWEHLLADYNDGKVHFMGDLTTNEERRKTHFMTGAISERLLKAFKIEGTPSIADIAKSRSPRLAFTRGFAPFDQVREVVDFAFEPVFVNNHSEAYKAIKNGRADAFLAMNVAEPALERYGEVVSETFYPLVFTPVSLSAQKADLEPVISLVQKALDNGGTNYLAGLYDQGRRDYTKNKFLSCLTSEELTYIWRRPVVKIATESDSYPLSFYSHNDHELQGIAFDVMKELDLITGLHFQVTNDLNGGFRDLTDMVERGKASMITAMMRSGEREGHFLLPNVPLMKEYPILISKTEFPSVHFNELANVTVGLVRGTLHAELFKRWFPDNRTYKEYDSLDSAFSALVRGEVDMFMSMSNYLLSIEHYKELVGYKANVVFDNHFDITFGFNKDETVLYSIVDKALQLTDLKAISRYWTHKTYDYRTKVAEERLPWLTGATTLFLVTLGLVLAFFYRGRNLSKQKVAEAKAKKAEERTAIMLDATPLACTMIDRNISIIDCNKEALNLFEVPTKQEYLERFFEFWPECQHDGQNSLEKGRPLFEHAFEHGHAAFEWLHIVGGEPMLAEVTLVRVEYDGEYVLAGYTRDLRAIKASEAKAREADERAKLMLEQTPLAISLWDKDFRIVDCNKEAIRITGVSSKEDYCERFVELAQEYQLNGMKSLDLIQNALVQAMKTGYSRSECTMNHAITGEPIPFDVTIARVKYKGEDTLISYGLDLRERNAALAQMREADERAQLIFDSAPLASCLFGDQVIAHNSSVLDCNQEMVNMFGIPNKEFFANNFFTLLLPKHQPNGEPSVEVSVSNGRIAFEKGYHRFECMHQKLDGTPLPSEITLVRVKHKGGYALAGYFRDLTEQKEKARLTELLVEKTSTLTAIFDSATDLIFVKDLHSIHTECNKAMINFLNVPKEYIIGKDDTEAFGWSAEKAAIHMAADNKVFNERRSVTVEEYIPASDGTLLLFETIKMPLIQEGKVTGLVGMARDITQRKEMARQQAEAEAANRAKSAFLATMSHEIRTPMNAISGMAELLLRRDIPDEAKADAHDIKQAASNLISIINDILDLSKIEAGKMEIIPIKYMLLSLVNDTVNIIRMRLTEKPIRFYTNIDSKIPCILIGDETRLRQVLLNLLSNAVKYTEKGHISLSITLQKRENEQVWLEITVTDSGRGVKPEDQTKLFGNFVQLDSKKNRDIEGTGLGLAITRQLCLAMNGDITFQSEYGKGSQFKVVIPQGVNSEVAFATVKDAANKKVLVYEQRIIYAKSVCWSLENLGVPYLMTNTLDDFSKALAREEWYYIFSGYGLYEIIKQLMEQTVFLNGKTPPLALMVEWENEARIPNVCFVSLPVQSMSIANVLNGKANPNNYFNTQNSGLIRYIYPEARLLLVDDIATNLKVAEGLLAPYHTKIDKCLSGARAVELVKRHKYDIVFMDHMMPEMDGIEATAAIRSWEAEMGQHNVPIVALTANAISGMREVFIENGFSDFLAKPIDISKLDEIITHWIPKEKRGRIDEKSEIKNEMNSPATTNTAAATPSLFIPSFSNIPGVDIQTGISMTGGTMPLYRQVVHLFRNDAEERLPFLQNVPEASALPGFITQIHAIKSASASIGAAEISARAAELEAAGKASDIDFIQGNLPSFAENLTELVSGIKAWESAEKEQDVPNAGYDHEAATLLLHELAVTLETEKVGDIDRILEELMQQTLDAKTKESLEKISDNVLITEFASAAEIVRSLLTSDLGTS